MHNPKIQVADQSAPSDMMKAIGDGRCRYLGVSQSTMLMFFRAAGDKPGRIVVPEFPDLPPGYFVESVHHDWARSSFVFRVFHPAFEPVGPGTRPDVDMRVATFPVSFPTSAYAWSPEPRPDPGIPPGSGDWPSPPADPPRRIGREFL